MTASRGQLQVWAAAYITAWLDEDFWTAARIAAALQDSGATAGQVAETFSLTAAALLADATGTPAARAAAGLRRSRQVAAETRTLTGG